MFKIFTVLYLTIKLEKSNSSRKKFTNSAISHPNGETDLHTVPDMPAGAGGPRRWHLKKADSECPPDGPPLPESPPAADLRLEGLQLPGGGAGEEEQGDQVGHCHQGVEDVGEIPHHLQTLSGAEKGRQGEENSIERDGPNGK